MRLLLDTHVLIWALIVPRKLPQQIASLIADGRNDVSFSAATILEIAIGRAAGRRNAPKLTAQQAATLALEAGYKAVAITEVHAAATETIAPYHSDPYDRLILAQAQIEGLSLVTHDEALAAYDSRVILF